MPTTTVAAIERQLDFRAPPERLWRALTDDGELGAWFGERAQLDLREGGDGWFEFEGYGRVPVRIEVFDPVTRLSWRWGDAGKSVDDRSTAGRVPAGIADRAAARGCTCGSPGSPMRTPAGATPKAG